jgi:hypothetical protein
MEAAGASGVRDFGISPALGWHLMGTARMGRDPKTSVLNQSRYVNESLPGAAFAWAMSSGML